MSLILDALKRSEEERRQGATAPTGILYVKSPGQQKYRGLFWLIIALAALNLIVLALLLRPSQSVPPASQNVLHDNTAMLPVDTPQHKPTPEDASKHAILSPAGVQSPDATPNQTLASLVQEASVAPSQTSKPSAPRAAPKPAEPAASRTGTNPPLAIDNNTLSPAQQPMGDARIRDAFSGYEINAIVVREPASRSFALINMQKYREGDILENTQLRLKRILPQGVLIENDGAEALLKPTP